MIRGGSNACSVIGCVLCGGGTNPPHVIAYGNDSWSTEQLAWRGLAWRGLSEWMSLQARLYKDNSLCTALSKRVEIRISAQMEAKWKRNALRFHLQYANLSSRALRFSSGAGQATIFYVQVCDCEDKIFASLSGNFQGPVYGPWIRLWRAYPAADVFVLSPVLYLLIGSQMEPALGGAVSID